MTEARATMALPTPTGVAAARWLGRTWARLSYGRRIEPTWLESNEIRQPVDDLPHVHEGLRIAHLTDFHGGEHLPPHYLLEVVDRTMALKPDLIALTGDFVHKGYRHVDDVARELGALRAPLGVYAVLGNHDYSIRNAFGFRRHPHLHTAVADALTASGVRVLRNETAVLRRGDSALLLTGVDDLWSRECDPDRAFAVPVSALTPRPDAIVRPFDPPALRDVIVIVAAPHDALVRRFVADLLRRGLPMPLVSPAAAASAIPA